MEIHVVEHTAVRAGALRALLLGGKLRYGVLGVLIVDNAITKVCGSGCREGCQWMPVEMPVGGRVKSLGITGVFAFMPLSH
jgi:hypothetical protein